MANGIVGETLGLVLFDDAFSFFRGSADNYSSCAHDFRLWILFN